MAIRSWREHCPRGVTGITAAKQLSADRGKNTAHLEKLLRTKSGAGVVNDMQTCAPLEARRWFKLRAPVNWAISVIVFIGLFYGLLFVFDGWVAGVIAIAVAGSLHF